jgi:hypothetical protein
VRQIYQGDQTGVTNQPNAPKFLRRAERNRDQADVHQQSQVLHCLGVRSHGEIENGLAVIFYRGDQNYNNSTVILFDGDTRPATF